MNAIAITSCDRDVSRRVDVIVVESECSEMADSSTMARAGVGGGTSTAPEAAQ
jgi:hypothetical protein